MIPVVLYQGRSIQSFGGPVEVRYIDISAYSYSKWSNARNAVNEDLVPFYERDFILTEDPDIKGSPVINPLETRAKWLTDPALNAEVMRVISDPNFTDSYIQRVPKMYSENEFLSMWNAAVKNQMESQTEAEKAVTGAATVYVQPAVPTQIVPPRIEPVYAASNVIPEPIQTTTVQNIQPVEPTLQNIAPQPVTIQPIQATPTNLGLPVTQTKTETNTNVAYTPQNIINGSYSVGGINNTIAPEAIVNMQPVSVTPNEVLEAAKQTQEAPVASGETPTMSQTEINLNTVQDLDSIISQLPQ